MAGRLLITGYKSIMRISGMVRVQSMLRFWVQIVNPLTYGHTQVQNVTKPNITLHPNTGPRFRKLIGTRTLILTPTLYPRTTLQSSAIDSNFKDSVIARHDATLEVRDQSDGWVMVMATFRIRVKLGERI